MKFSGSARDWVPVDFIPGVPIVQSGSATLKAGGKFNFPVAPGAGYMPN